MARLSRVVWQHAQWQSAIEKMDVNYMIVLRSYSDEKFFMLTTFLNLNTLGQKHLQMIYLKSSQILKSMSGLLCQWLQIMKKKFSV